jgi:hypothetical protein
MSATHSAIHFARNGAEIMVDNGSESFASGDKSVERQAFCKKFQFQDGIPYVDEDCDSDTTQQIHDGGPRETSVTRSTVKMELNTLTHLARRPAVDIEFQDLSYSVRSPGRREGKPDQILAINFVPIFIILTNTMSINMFMQ